MAAKKKAKEHRIEMKPRQQSTLLKLLDAAKQFEAEARAAKQRVTMYIQNTKDVHNIPEEFVGVMIEDDGSAVTFSKPKDEAPKNDK